MMLGLGLALGSARVQTLLTSVASVLDQLYIFKPGAMYSSSTGGDLVDTSAQAFGAVLDQSSMAGQDPQAWLAGQTNLVENGGFDDDLSGWVLQVGSITVSGGVAVFDGFSRMTQQLTVSAEKTLFVYFTTTSTKWAVRVGDDSSGLTGSEGVLSGTAVGSHLLVVKTTVENPYLSLVAVNPGNFDDIIVKSSDNPPATQLVDADRPTYIKDVSTHLARFNGSNQELQIPVDGQTYLAVAVDTDDTASVLFNDRNASGHIVGAFRNSVSDVVQDAGTPSIYINGDLITTDGSTFSQTAFLSAYQSYSGMRIVEFVGLDLSDFGGKLVISGFAGYEFSGDIAFIAMRTTAPTDAERQIIRNAAQAATEGRL